MAGRRVKPPRNVTVASLADTGDPATDRVMIQAEQNLQDLQEQQRTAQATATSQGAAITALQTSVAAVPTSGRLLAVQVFTSSGPYTPTSGTTQIRLRLQAPGGPGGGAVAGVGVVSVGGGGSSGAYVEIDLTGAAVGGGTVTIGAAGAPTTGTGPTSGDVTVVIAGTTYTAKGGAGGTGGTQSGTLGAAPGGAAPSGNSSDGSQTADSGRNALVFSTGGGGLGYAGGGGMAQLGMPGSTAASNTQPSQPAGYGGGGAGAFAVNASILGGPAGPGRVEIEEYS